jgi:DNA primase large subunit
MTKKELIGIIKAASEEALKEMRNQFVGLGKMSKDDFGVFVTAVRESLDETEEEFLNNNYRAPDLSLNAKLVATANEAAKEEGKSFSEWLTELIVKELFY